MKPARAFLAIPLALAALYPSTTRLHAQPQNQSGARQEAGKQSAPVPKPAGPDGQGPDTAGPTPPKPPAPAAGPAEREPQQIRGQGTVKGSRANPAPDGKIPGGQAGSGGHKTNEFGR